MITRIVKKGILYLLCVLGLSSCADHLLTKEDLKLNFSRPERPRMESRRLVAAREDSVQVLSEPIDTLRWKDKKGNQQKAVMTGEEQMHVSYSETNGWWERGFHARFRTNQIYIRNDTLYSTGPVRAGMFQRKKEMFIPLEHVSELRIKHISSADNHLSILTEVLAPVDFYGGPSYRLGAELKVWRNLALYAEAGGYYSYLPSGDQSALRGSIFLPEIKYYLNTAGFTTGRYVALQYTYKDQKNNLSDTVTLPGPPPPVRIKKGYTLYTILQSINLKYGNEVIRSNHLTLDYFGGIGVDFRNSSTSLSPSEQNSIVHTGDYSITESRFAPGKTIYPNITFGFRIGFHVY